MDYIILPLADFLQWSFGIFEVLGNMPNWAFIAAGIFGLGYWLMMQGRYNKRAAAEGTYK